MITVIQANFDTPWKAAVKHFFRQLMMFVPDAYADIDWTRPFEFLDKELHSLLRDSDTGNRTVDTLVKVWLKDGEAAWVLVHIEVKAQRQNEFPERVYVYNYRIYDHFRRPVMSLVILADDDPNWKPNSFGYNVWDCKPSIEFPVFKLLDFEARWAELEASDNPFAMVIMAHLRTLSSRSDVDERYRWKLRLTRMLFHKGWVREDIIALLRFIDWVLTLPPELEQKLTLEIKEQEGVEKVEYLSNIERWGIEKGILQNARHAVLQVLTAKFQSAPPEVADAIDRIEDTGALDDLLARAATSPSLEDFRQALPAV